MKKILIMLGVCMATVAIAETDYIAMPRIEAIVSGEEAIVLNATSATVTGTLTADAMFVVYTGTGSTNVQLSAVTPRAKCQFAYSAANVLSALSGAGTTGVLAVAKGTTTNDWIIVK